MAALQDYYEILQVSPNADIEIIQVAHKRLAFKWHPDRRPGDPSANERMKLLNEACEVLTNPQKRTEYDSTRRQAAANRVAEEAACREAGQGTRAERERKRDLERQRQEAERRRQRNPQNVETETARQKPDERMTPPPPEYSLAKAATICLGFVLLPPVLMGLVWVSSGGKLPPSKVPVWAVTRQQQEDWRKAQPTPWDKATLGDKLERVAMAEVFLSGGPLVLVCWCYLSTKRAEKRWCQQQPGRTLADLKKAREAAKQQKQGPPDKNRDEEQKHQDAEAESKDQERRRRDAEQAAERKPEGERQRHEEERIRKEQERLRRDADQATERLLQVERERQDAERIRREQDRQRRNAEAAAERLLQEERQRQDAERELREQGCQQIDAEQTDEDLLPRGHQRSGAEEDADQEKTRRSAQFSSARIAAQCERCEQEPRMKRERFCKKCRKVILDELKEKGYLTSAPLYPGAWTPQRTRDQREKSPEGTSPWQDNAIRAMEGD